MCLIHRGASSAAEDCFRCMERHRSIWQIVASVRSSSLDQPLFHPHDTLMSSQPMSWSCIVSPVRITAAAESQVVLSLIARVEKPCPHGWWGSPACGPCNCDTGRGFHKDCNKTSGECRCKVTFTSTLGYLAIKVSQKHYYFPSMSLGECRFT